MGEISFNMLTKHSAFTGPNILESSLNLITFKMKSPLSTKEDQFIQTNDLDQPNLNLSAYLEHESQNKSVDIALQVGDSLRES